jgi:hypothetical protein
MLINLSDRVAGKISNERRVFSVKRADPLSITLLLYRHKAEPPIGKLENPGVVRVMIVTREHSIKDDKTHLDDD